MLTEYGTACLEFDFREYQEPIYKCEYYTEEDLAELYRVMIRDIQSMEGITRESSDELKLRKIYKLITLEMDLKAKIASIKLKDEWESEGEWRFVLHKQVNDERYFHDVDGYERLKMYIPIAYLTGITLFYDDDTRDEMKVLSRRIKDLRKWNKLGRFNVKLMRIRS